jgi:Raf kinase inhibitor-like YbhB/YbcL family protein
VSRHDRTGPLRVLLACSLACLLGGCGLIGGPKLLRGDAPQIMTVTSPVFRQGTIPRRYTCAGPGESPPIYWSGTPRGTKSLALVVDDANAPITPRVYWIVFDIDPARAGIQAGQLPPGARQARNSAGRASYDPPCPTPGDHRYRFSIYALSTVLRGLPNGSGLKATWSAIAHYAIARGTVSASAQYGQ